MSEVFARDECLFHFCPTPDGCREECAYPASRATRDADAFERALLAAVDDLNAGCLNDDPGHYLALVPAERHEAFTRCLTAVMAARGPSRHDRVTPEGTAAAKAAVAAARDETAPPQQQETCRLCGGERDDPNTYRGHACWNSFHDLQQETGTRKLDDATVNRAAAAYMLAGDCGDSTQCGHGCMTTHEHRMRAALAAAFRPTGSGRDESEPTCRYCGRTRAFRGFRPRPEVPGSAGAPCQDPWHDGSSHSPSTGDGERDMRDDLREWAEMHEALRPYWMRQESMTAAQAIRQLVALAASSSSAETGDGREMYDAGARTRATLADADAAVGQRARLPLTGTITEAGESANGAFAMFQVDVRWGFQPGMQFGADLEAFELLGEAEPLREIPSKEGS